jgi:hypothetical protein
MLAERSNRLTESMEIIAQDTARETVSMRVITIVTLFFLPGTFISVGTPLHQLRISLTSQTLMSTSIVTFEAGSPSLAQGSISTGALGFFAAVSVPLMLVTLLAWWVVHWWEGRKEKQRREKSRALCVAV